MTVLVERKTALGMRQGKLRQRGDGRKTPALGLVLHTTGAGVYTRWQRHPHRLNSPYEAAQHVYEHISPYCGHYLVDGESGAVTQLVPTNYVAWHVGSSGSGRYRWKSWSKDKNFDWWFDRFPRCGSPRDLMGGGLWRAGSANAVSIGIEVAPPLSGPRDPWSDACWETLRRLIRALTHKYEIPRTTEHVITHSDAHPLARSTVKGSPWDPGVQWDPAEAAERLLLK